MMLYGPYLRLSASRDLLDLRLQIGIDDAWNSNFEVRVGQQWWQSERLGYQKVAQDRSTVRVARNIC